MEEIKGALAKYNFAFKKKWGQNFLDDPNLLDAIVRDAGVDSETTALEIGAGAGALTRALSKHAKKVVAYEIDRTLEPVLAETLAACMMRFLEEAKMCRGVTVMVQEEVALRLCAREDTPEYGAITAAVALKGTAHITRKVPRAMFTPRPNVDSAVVKVTFGGGVAVKSENAYRFAVRTAFSSRRKTLENNLMGAAGIGREEAKEVLRAAGVPEGARGETLSPAAFACLADILYERGMVK